MLLRLSFSYRTTFIFFFITFLYFLNLLQWLCINFIIRVNISPLNAKKKKRNKDKNPQKSQILPCSVFKENTGAKKQLQ